MSAERSICKGGLSSPKHRIGGGSGGQKVAGLYDLEETLGEGHYAVVKSARHVFTGERVAVKVIDKMKLDAATRLQMMQEVRLMKLVQHPHVVRLYEVIDTQTKLYLILELADGGDMYDYIMKHEGGLEEDTARKYFRQIVHAIQYCHQLHVVHRDLKPENVVFFEKLGMVKLTDFGFSNKFNPGQQLQTSCGSLYYSAPEILLGDAYDAPAVDVWSLGVILYMLVCGSAPFQEANDSETLTMIMDCKYTFPSHISTQCKSLISRMLQRQPDLRASLDDIIKDPWVETDAPSTAAADAAFMLPLVSRQHLSNEDHAVILQKMAAGDIASKEDIIDALDRNEYNHITATYFLLAERKLRAQRLDQANRSKSKQQALKLDRFAPRRPTTTTLDSSSNTTRNLVESTKEKDNSGTETPNVSAWLSPRESVAPEFGSSNNGAKPAPAAAPLPPSNTLGLLKYRVRKCSIVEEDEEDEDEEEEESNLQASKHLSLSSNSIPLDAIKEVVAPIQVAAEAAQQQQQHQATSNVETPAPFPVSSHIGSGNLSRQNSLRQRSNDTSTSSERSSPSSPPGSNASSSQSSPARYKIALPNRKLVSTRSSPQLVQSAPVLKEIHEEVEEGDPVDNFPTSRAGSAVIRRLEHRRRIRLHKNRTQSCSSSDASDDDGSDSRKKRHEKHAASTHFTTKRENNNDDSSDNQDSGVGRTTSATRASSAGTYHATSGTKSSETDSKQDGGGGGKAGSTGTQRNVSSKPVAIAEEDEDDDDFVAPGPEILRRMRRLEVRKFSADSTDSSEWEEDQERTRRVWDNVEKNTGLQILKKRLNKLKQDNNNSKNLHRAHSCSSLFALQQNLVRHRRLSCQATSAILDIFEKSDCKKNSLAMLQQFLNPSSSSCFDVC